MAHDFKTLIWGRMRQRGNDESIAQAFVEDMQALFTRQGVVETPLLVLRVDDVFANYLLVIQAEKALDDAQEQPDKDESIRISKPIALGLEENVGKARERLRKSMKELEESCTRAGTPIDIGLADLMKPILKKAEGVLDDALRAEPTKRRDVRKKTNGLKSTT